MPAKDTTRYIEAVGRRKTSTARVRVVPAGKQELTINGKSVDAYFPTDTMRTNILAPFRVSGTEQKFVVTAKVSGGGIFSQSEAVRHGITRALIAFEANLRKSLKAEGFVKRDPRMKERRKFGLKKARRAPQWSKR